MPEFVALLSYAQLDDECEHGRLSVLRECLENAVRQRTGDKNFRIFQDKKGILWGSNWKQTIEQALQDVFVLIPIMTPLYLQSEPCKEEYEIFLKREKKLGRNDLILPIYWIDCDELDDQKRRDSNAWAKGLAEHQRADLRELRFTRLESLEALRVIDGLAVQLKQVLQTSLTAPPPVQPKPMPSTRMAPIVAARAIAVDNATPTILGDVVTVTGIGFIPGENVTLSLSGGTIQYAPWTSSSPVGVWVNADGGFTALVIVTSGTVGEAYDLTATGDQSGAASPVVLMLKEPKIMSVPTIKTAFGANAATDKLAIGVQGFRRSRQLDVSFAGVSIAATDMEPRGIPTTNAYGAFLTTIRIPLADKGTGANQVRVAETVGITPLSLATGFTVGIGVGVTKFALPQWSVTNVAPGKPLYVYGTGFGASEQGIVVRWSDAAAVTYFGTVGSPTDSVLASAITADSKGKWSTQVAAPEATAGWHRVSAGGTAAGTWGAPTAMQSMTAAIQIVPSDVLGSAFGRAGDVIQISGRGFAGSTPAGPVYISISMGGVIAVTSPTAIRTNALGTFSASFEVPQLPARSAVHVPVRAVDDSVAANATEVPFVYAVDA